MSENKAVKKVGSAWKELVEKEPGVERYEIVVFQALQKLSDHVPRDICSGLIEVEFPGDKKSVEIFAELADIYEKECMLR